MIAKSIENDSIANLIAYVTRGEATSEVGSIEIDNLTSFEAATREMERLAKTSTRCEKPAWHIVLAWRFNEFDPESSQADRQKHMLAMAREVVGELDLLDRQAVYAVHWDKKDGLAPGQRHYDAHIAINRIGPDGLAASMWNDFARVEKAVAKVAAKHEKLVVPGRHNRIGDDPYQGKNREGDRSRQLRDQTGRASFAEEFLANETLIEQLRRCRTDQDVETFFDCLGVYNLGVRIAESGKKRVQKDTERKLRPGFVVFDLGAPTRACAFSTLDSSAEKWGQGALESIFGADEIAQYLSPAPSKSPVAKSTKGRGDSPEYRAFNAQRTAVMESNKALRQRRDDAKSYARQVLFERQSKLRNVMRKGDSCLRRAPIGTWLLELSVHLFVCFIHARRVKKARRFLDTIDSDFRLKLRETPTWTSWKRAAEFEAAKARAAQEQLAADIRDLEKPQTAQETVQSISKDAGTIDQPQSQDVEHTVLKRQQGLVTPYRGGFSWLRRPVIAPDKKIGEKSATAETPATIFAAARERVRAAISRSPAELAYELGNSFSLSARHASMDLNSVITTREGLASSEALNPDLGTVPKAPVSPHAIEVAPRDDGSIVSQTATSAPDAIIHENNAPMVTVPPTGPVIIPRRKSDLELQEIRYDKEVARRHGEAKKSDPTPERARSLLPTADVVIVTLTPQLAAKATANVTMHENNILLTSPSVDSALTKVPSEKSGEFSNDRTSNMPTRQSAENNITGQNSAPVRPVSARTVTSDDVAAALAEMRKTFAPDPPPWRAVSSAPTVSQSRPENPIEVASARNQPVVTAEHTDRKDVSVHGGPSQAIAAALTPKRVSDSHIDATPNPMSSNGQSHSQARSQVKVSDPNIDRRNRIPELAALEKAKADQQVEKNVIIAESASTDAQTTAAIEFNRILDHEIAHARYFASNKNRNEEETLAIQQSVIGPSAWIGDDGKPVISLDVITAFDRKQSVVDLRIQSSCFSSDNSTNENPALMYFLTEKAEARLKLAKRDQDAMQRLDLYDRFFLVNENAVERNQLGLANADRPGVRYLNIGMLRENIRMDPARAEIKLKFLKAAIGRSRRNLGALKRDNNMVRANEKEKSVGGRPMTG
jgi:Relaxase/Mobilisation nuclease domain